MKEHAVLCSGRIPIVCLPYKSNFAWAKKQKLPPVLCGLTQFKIWENPSMLVYQPAYQNLVLKLC